MLPCPWPTTAAATPSTGAAPAPPGVIEAPRGGIPDCAPPGWKPPAELKPHNPPPLPADRPKAIVDDYLKYVVTAPPQQIIDRFKLDTTFYKKYADANGYPILASAKVADAALAIVRDQVNYMLGNRPDIRDTMIAHGARIVVQAETEYTVDVPEQRGWVVPKYLDPRLTPQERATLLRAGRSRLDDRRGLLESARARHGRHAHDAAPKKTFSGSTERATGERISASMSSRMGSWAPASATPTRSGFRQSWIHYKHAKASCLSTANGYSGQHVQRVLGRRRRVVRREWRPRSRWAEAGRSNAV